MNREIKFRGKQLNDMPETSNMYASKKGTWRYGTYKYIHKYYDGVNAHMICDIYGREIMCDSNTIGQFTGLKDKNGKEIYEGDVVMVQDYINGVVEWNDDRCRFCVFTELKYNEKTAKENCIYETHEYRLDKQTANRYCKIIGNIHDKE